METIVILTTAGVTVLWSVRSFFLVGNRLGMADESTFRIVTIASPSVYFLLLVAAGLHREVAVRLDLIGMIILDVVSVLTLLGSFIVQIIPEKRRGLFGVLLFIMYHGLAVLCVAGVFLVRSSPVLLLSLKSILRRISEVEVFSFQWIGLDAESQEQDIVSMFNSFFIAVLSYLPIALLRFLTGIRHKRRTDRDIEQLKQRLELLERASHRGDL